MLPFRPVSRVITGLAQHNPAKQGDGQSGGRRTGRASKPEHLAPVYGKVRGDGGDSSSCPVSDGSACAADSTGQAQFWYAVARAAANSPRAARPSSATEEGSGTVWLKVKLSTLPSKMPPNATSWIVGFVL